jgi:predicted TIM-barrel fold metal-dependent hydrolase
MPSKSVLSKGFAVFDCDAHVNDPPEIWEKYVEPGERELVKQAYWRDKTGGMLNGKWRVISGAEADFVSFNPACSAGPGMSNRLLRRLQQMSLNEEQKDYLLHKGAYSARARLRDMDLMGIDQVLVIPTMMVSHFPFIESADGARALARAYNTWAHDWCQEAPDRLFPAGWLPVQDTRYSVDELRRIAGKGFRVALIRPVDVGGNYPNRINPQSGAGTVRGTMWDPIYRAFEETGLVVGMHTFTASQARFTSVTPAGDAVRPGSVPFSPGQFIHYAGAGTGRMVDTQTLSFIFEAMTWLAQVLLSGFLDRYPRLKMAIFESNSTWLPALLERCDRLCKLYANERTAPLKRLPSEAFFDQCMIAFESDERTVFRLWDTHFEDVGIWSSDAYHHDGADAWKSIRAMTDVGVPERVQAKLMGENARRFYGIEGRLYVTHEPEVIERPGWFPKQDEEFEAWWKREANPRVHGRQRAAIGNQYALGQ